MEQGSVLYLNGDYFQALQSFDKADALAEKLYTTSVSKTALQITREPPMKGFY